MLQTCMFLSTSSPGPCNKVLVGYHSLLDNGNPSHGSVLKQSLISPAQPRRAETRLLPCSVLASFRLSTLSRIFGDRKHLRGFSVRQDPLLRANGPHKVRSVPPRSFTRCGLAERTF